ncbi:tRNA pseudouridine(13) synthase TruD [Thermus tengchongensis]|uniref:tRNA pseudouridine synthase D n=1 Tax=Thermus tengchongensis TaxID=1214928 RepID=A0ABY2K8T3_9DEIN|nr:tRNA pseudouridine(13) synthase TruD [Thermus tengchongensis]TFU15871.1 tRNA pseudouridine(13) synthase TruD [Thermus tengchongensis]
MDLVFRPERYPFLTQDLPGVGGTIRLLPEDFQVEEVPAYLPSGEGEHLYFLLEKEGLTTRQVVEFLRDEVGVPEKAIGVAGLKDKHAKTRQWFSIPRQHEDALCLLENLRGVRLLDAGLHTNKLRTGHLKGNRFRILIRGAKDREKAEAILKALAEKGLPNYYGPQRFGLGGLNPVRGYQLVKRGKGRGSPWLKRFLVGSLQSLLFNDWVALRMARGLYDRVVPGDWAKKHATGGEFLVEREEEAERALRLEISATGPLFGKKYPEAQGEARALEDEILARYGLRREDFALRRGARRPIRVPLQEWRVEEVPEGLWLAFFLPKGSYATSLLREVMKVEVDAPEEILTEEGE